MVVDEEMGAMVSLLRPWMARRGLVLGASTTLLIALVAVLLASEARKDEPAASPFPATASATYNDGSSTTRFDNVGEMVATAAFAVEGSIEAVEQGDPVRLSDGSGDEIVPRILVVETRTVFHRRNPESTVPTTLRITDGYWKDGVGYERESTGWASAGQTGFFLVTRDQGPDGSLLSTYSPLDGSGIAFVAEGRLTYAHHGVWRSLGGAATPAEFRDALTRGASAARSGSAVPVPVTTCHPSVPGDESSAPICEEE